MLIPLHCRRAKGFILVEIMLVVSIIAMLGTVAMPNYLGSRGRSEASVVTDGMCALESAMSLSTRENNRRGADAISVADIPAFLPYTKTDSKLYQLLPNDMLGKPIALSTLDSPPKLSSGTFTALSDSAPREFRSPYYP